MTRSRSAFTLPELIVALTLATLVGAAITTFLVRQMRTYANLDTTIHAHTNMRDVATLLSADFRTLATTDTFAFASDTALQYQALIGSSHVCANTTTTQIPLAPYTETDPRALSVWITLPKVDDAVLIYHQAPSGFTWHRYHITDVTTRPANVCTSLTWPVLDTVVPSAQHYTITVTPPPQDPIEPGAPIRFLRTSRYNIYRASDNLWYLGLKECTSAGICNTVQPVAGPYGKGTAPPLTFRYYDSAGTRITTTQHVSNVARITLAIRSHAHPTDSLITSVAFRNR